VSAAPLPAETPASADTITVLEGFDALRLFLETTWRRHSLPADAIAFILGGAHFADGTPVDPAMWQDWIMAVQATRRAPPAADRNHSADEREQGQPR
jgi:hypothetical protein